MVLLVTLVLVAFVVTIRILVLIPTELVGIKKDPAVITLCRAPLPLLHLKINIPTSLASFVDL